MKKIFCCIFCFTTFLFAQWQMFSDKTDTYIYNTTTGEIYIRYKKNGKNYEDLFVKMPKGIIPEKQNNLPSSLEPKKDDVALEAIKKANELMNHSIDGGL
ncbi:hypothetical protein BKH41_00575 [Helicobacter sp. 12S02232-10]|uniref:hypothetical protein n=1 Tax=Helicobacter sp. 12S02232-10 TaxID=1476197 RepID=UPI000BA70BB1|nr:hypothetical protein [Helicobacter sp. 12S02232-10]PAF49831.1 hypothetical protein BKH41_00575 [Helicobacter sp. 12S02232-10]